MRVSYLPVMLRCWGKLKALAVQDLFWMGFRLEGVLQLMCGSINAKMKDGMERRMVNRVK